MKKFSFEFESILEYRQFTQEQAEGELAKALGVESEINNNLNTIALRYVQLKKGIAGSRNFEDILSTNQHIQLLNYQKEELMKQLAEAKLVTEEKRKILQECMKKTSALEQLKTIEKQEYQAEAEKEEQARLEELASIKGFADSKNE